jgi:hypothetical protein
VPCHVGIVALHRVEAEPSVCKGGGCEGKVMPDLVLLLHLQVVYCKALLGFHYDVCVRSDIRRKDGAIAIHGGEIRGVDADGKPWRILAYSKLLDCISLERTLAMRTGYRQGRIGCRGSNNY